jgi:triacylglycerol lipase
MTSGVGFELPAPSQYAYYADSTKLKDMESLPGLLKTNVPLFITRAEFDPPEIAEGVERLNKALCDAGRCPAVFGRNQGENHMSQIYSVGTVDRRLTIKVAAFIRELAH